jgi:hypothetical protein
VEAERRANAAARRVEEYQEREENESNDESRPKGLRAAVLFTCCLVGCSGLLGLFGHLSRLDSLKQLLKPYEEPV